MGFFQNTCKPKGVMGTIMLKGMNKGHAKLSEWAFQQISFQGNETVLDAGCGGGANLVKLIDCCPQGHVSGIDYSDKSVLISKKTVGDKLGICCNIQQGNVANLPYTSNSFDVVTAFETIYFWPDLHKCFEEIKRVLKKQGRFMVCCECSNPADRTWTDKIDGMTIYNKEQVELVLKRAGFKIDTSVQQPDKEWICIIGRT